jgi:general stress protein YciG
MGDADEGDEKETELPAKRPRGFAAMTPEQRRECGRRGGRLAHENGTANRFDSESASAAGRIPHERGTAFHWTPEQAREAGRKGRGVPRPRRRRAEPT